MRFLGVDLASEPRRTGVVVATLEDGVLRATLAPEGVGTDDEGLIALVDGATVVGLDAPLGWPDDFVDAVAAHRAFAPWPGGDGAGPRARERLRLRATDRFVRDLGLGVTPLSASSDLLGVVAMRAAWLQGAWATRWGGPEPRDGRARLVEVYPAAALLVWGLREGRGARYKSGPAAARGAMRAERARMLGVLRDATRGWLDLDEACAGAAVESDHVFDAIVCVLSAVAARCAATLAAPEELCERAAREGWIHVPACDLAELGARLARRGVEGSD